VELAAGSNALSSVLQRRANKRVPQRENMSLRQIWVLLHQPVWFGGILAITAGFLLQATALGSGDLAVVEPVLVLELPFALIISSRMFRQHLGLREWLPTLADDDSAEQDGPAGRSPGEDHVLSGSGT
jgi:hypothetical protein